MSKPRVHKADRMIALYHVTAAYHSGMGSRGYRILCRVQRWCKKNGVEPWNHKPRNGSIPRIVKSLVATYGDKL